MTLLQKPHEMSSHLGQKPAATPSSVLGDDDEDDSF